MCWNVKSVYITGVERTEGEERKIFGKLMVCTETCEEKRRVLEIGAINAEVLDR